MVDFRLYLITDRHVTKLPLSEAVRLALEGGVRAVQLREKDLPVRELLALAQELRKVTRDFGARLFVNDRVDVAVAVEADGVHLGGLSMPVHAVRKIVGKEMLIGASTHNVSEARTAEEDGADFITLGPIFETLSKAKYGAPVGLAALFGLRNAIKLPIFALGGIKSGNVDQVISSGAYGVSLISAILGAEDIRRSAKEMNERIGEAAKP
jgi:thiamine-phosphate pyrophosphorylase